MVKRSWTYTQKVYLFFFVVEENLFLFWNNSFPIMYHMTITFHMTITVRCANFCNYLTSLCWSFVICKREMIIVPPSVECLKIKQLLTLSRSLVTIILLFFSACPMVIMRILVVKRCRAVICICYVHYPILTTW